MLPELLAHKAVNRGSSASTPLPGATHFEVWVLVWSFFAYGVARVASDFGISFLYQSLGLDSQETLGSHFGIQIWVQIFCLALSLLLGKGLNHFSNPTHQARGKIQNLKKLQIFKNFLKNQSEKLKGVDWAWFQDSLFWVLLMVAGVISLGSFSGLVSLEGFGLNLGTQLGLNWALFFSVDVMTFCLFYFLLRKFVIFSFSKFQILGESKNGWVISLGFEFFVWAQVLNLGFFSLSWPLVINLSFASALAVFHGFASLGPRKEKSVIRIFTLILANLFIFGLPLGDWEAISVFKVFEGPLLHQVHSQLGIFEHCPIPSIFALMMFSGIGIFWLDSRKWPRLWQNNF